MATLLALLFSLATPIGAQIPLEDAVGEVVRLRAGDTRYRGTLVDADTAALQVRIASTGLLLSVPSSVVESLEMRTEVLGAGRGFVRGFVRGGIIGFAVGAIVVATIYFSGDEGCNDCWVSPVAEAVILTPPFALSTALVGGAIGSVALSERWTNVALPASDRLAIRLGPGGTARIGLGVGFR